MENNEKLSDTYKNFKNFLGTSVSKELEYFILDSRFTSEFNYRMKKLFDEIRNQNRREIEFSIIFNTKGEISLIDSLIVGEFIADDYVVNLQRNYKNVQLNKILKEILNGSEKVKNDFVLVSCIVLYDIVEMIYKDIKCRIDIIHYYANKYKLNIEDNRHIASIVIMILIMEDICGYMNVDKKLLKNSINLAISSKKF
ncbi:hypothetical protein [Clostridium botulinum]|uniref:hypothetical protein n=1 Tax=Clostridium botulinum TaxID=1491 RepID=UPI0004D92296|nr:hypothetical protein [Clostridium botulinum]KEI06898.1 hypothetical protein Z952_02450 [Clostridium botulinum C/D str. BKT75002]KEI08194.1 hypothetical protein Z954_01615 [Clostridium botulinum C/D str. BKT2873]MCD3350815.1 hypothetical protein [Clostridium botulinum D/C]MCD3359836.1 hypothetical protein [Clostridium botulinum D/C]MCD3361834.1 hypothetical protein [Clostridium botulinum D/C]